MMPTIGLHHSAKSSHRQPLKSLKCRWPAPEKHLRANVVEVVENFEICHVGGFNGVNPADPIGSLPHQLRESRKVKMPRTNQQQEMR